LAGGGPPKNRPGGGGETVFFRWDSLGGEKFLGFGHKGQKIWPPPWARGGGGGGGGGGRAPISCKVGAPAFF